jgi:hypothetical protein
MQMNADKILFYRRSSAFIGGWLSFYLHLSAFICG